MSLLFCCCTSVFPEAFGGQESFADQTGLFVTLRGIEADMISVTLAHWYDDRHLPDKGGHTPILIHNIDSHTTLAHTSHKILK